MGLMASKLLAKYWQEILMAIVAFVILSIILYYGSVQKAAGVEQGRQEAMAQYNRQLSEMQTAQLKHRNENAKIFLNQLAELKGKKDKEYVTIEKTITKPVYVERDCIDNDGLQIINNAVSRSR